MVVTVVTWAGGATLECTEVVTNKLCAAVLSVTGATVGIIAAGEGAGTADVSASTTVVFTAGTGAG